MFIQITKEYPNAGHMLDTDGKNKLAEALQNAEANITNRQTIEQKVILYQTPEDELE